MEPKGIIGWREWVHFPAFSDVKIKAKIDTGARTSALHAYDIETQKRGSLTTVSFKVHPHQRDSKTYFSAKAKVIEMRHIKNSGGTITERPVIEVPITIGAFSFNIELTLVNRMEMGFRMLLGREAIKNQFLVNPGHSFILSKKPKTRRPKR